jgi:hypothetical protein
MMLAAFDLQASFIAFISSSWPSPECALWVYEHLSVWRFTLM